MIVILAEKPGPPQVLSAVERPDPEPGPGQVLVDVAVAAITFVDTQMRAGTFPGLPASAFPVVLGNGVGGTVAAVGDGVDGAWLGTEVVTATGGRGGYASRALAAADDLHRVPPGLAVADGVALLADGRTALALIQAAEVAPGQTVVVTAAGGGVGGLLVKLARRAGAEVIALAGDERKRAHARALGAATTVDYRAEGWPDRIGEAAPAGLDVAFDGVGGDVGPALVARIRPGGRYLPHGAASGRWAAVDGAAVAERHITVIPLADVGGGPADMYRLVEQAFALAAAGELRPTVGQTYALTDAAAAHAAIEGRATVGKTLLRV
jgi:NADPH2:quinone reductase